MSAISLSGPTIIIFGAAVRPDGQPSGALRGRVRSALRLGGTLDAPHYMPTGGQGRYGPPEAEVMAGLLRAAGVPPEAITLEPTGRNTIGSVRACARLLPQGAPVYAATSGYHMPRCVLLLNLAGLDALACPPALTPASRRTGLRCYWRLREVVAVPVDTALMLFERARRRA